MSDQSARILFIGGSADGVWDRDPGTEATLHAPQFLVPLFRDSDGGPRPEDLLEMTQYRRQRIGWANRFWEVYLADGLTMEDCLEKLLKGYRQP